MIKELNVIQGSSETVDFTQYEAKFKALADQKRLKIMHELSQKGSVCVCDLMEIMEILSLSYPIISESYSMPNWSLSRPEEPGAIMN